MAHPISQRELRNDSGSIHRRAEAGETFVVTRNGVPTASLGPVRRRTYVSRAELLAAVAHAPVIDPQRFRADVDAVLDQSVPGA